MDSLARQRAATVAVWRADAAARPTGAWVDFDGLACHATGFAVPYWNGAHLTTVGGLARLAEATAWFARRGLPWGLLVPVELDVTVPWPVVAEQRVMTCGLEGLPPLPELELRRGHSQDVLAIQVDAFGDEDLEAFLTPKADVAGCTVLTAYRDGDPVATARVICIDGVAGLYGIGTVSSRRREGLGAAVTLAALHEAARRGCDLAFLNPSDLGYRMYASLGFTDSPGWRIHSPSAG